MKQKLKTWAIRVTATALFIAVLLVVIILNPVLTYAHKTLHNNYTIYHNAPLHPSFRAHLDLAAQLASSSECYNPKLRLDICLHDGTMYPKLVQCLRGQAFAWGFYNKVVLMGNADYRENFVELNGYKWNLTQLLAHEMIHCFQFDSRGFWKSNPVANIPVWKWEGYPEYIARQSTDQKELFHNIERLLQAEAAANNGWIQFADNTGTVIPYYKSWLLIQYCIDIQRMNYNQILSDTTREETVRQKMMNWYRRQKK